MTAHLLRSSNVTSSWASVDRSHFRLSDLFTSVVPYTENDDIDLNFRSPWSASPVFTGILGKSNTKQTESHDKYAYRRHYISIGNDTYQIQPVSGKFLPPKTDPQAPEGTSFLHAFIIIERNFLAACMQRRPHFTLELFSDAKLLPGPGTKMTPKKRNYTMLTSSTLLASN